MKGYMFKSKSYYYFIESTYQKKNKTLAKIFLNYFLSKQQNRDSISKLLIDNTFDRIYKEMRKVEIIPSTDNTAYFIHERYAGETIFQNELVLIDAN